MYSDLIYHPQTYTISWLESICNYEGIKTKVRFTNEGVGFLTVGGYNKYALYCYGNASSIMNSLNVAKEYGYMNKVTVILFDYPGYGISSGSPSEKSITDALDSVLEYFPKVTLIGESIGTGVVLSYAAKYGTSRISSIRLISPFTSILAVVSTNFLIKILYDITGSCFYNSLDNIKKISPDVPIHIFSLLQDKLIPLQHGKSLFECGRANIKLTEVSNDDFNHSNFGFFVAGFPFSETL